MPKTKGIGSPPIPTQEEFGSRLTSVGEKIAQIAETLRLYLEEAHL